MYQRIQIKDKETGQAVCALVASSNTVSLPTLAKWAAAVAALADSAAGQSGLHVCLETEHIAQAAAALTRLEGIGPGGGNHGVKQKGRCGVCGRLYPINKVGKLAKHGKQYRKGGVSNGRAAHCAGSGTKPRSAA